MAKKPGGLGMGLDALFGDNGGESGGSQTLRMSDIEPNRKQPRQSFDDAAIAELADSIRQHGLIQPIVVRPMGAGYQIVAGERRWRACRMLGMSEVPVIIKDFDDAQTAQIALIENVQREDLNPVEEALAYRSLMDDYDMTQEELSKAVGKSRSSIANAVRNIRPKFAVLDPRLTCSLPPYQTASGAVDMMAHIMERYFSPTPDVKLTDRLCEALMKTIVEAAPRAIAEPEDYVSHADLMWAGMLAHNNSCGVGRVQDWASHQIAHELSAFYDCAHGASLAVVMPAWMEYVMDRDVMRFARFAVEVFGCEMDYAYPQRTAKAGIARLRDFFRTLGMPLTLQDVGGKAEDIPAMVAHRAEKPNGFPFGGFVKIGPEEMEAVLRLTAGL